VRRLLQLKSMGDRLRTFTQSQCQGRGSHLGWTLCLLMLMVVPVRAQEDAEGRVIQAMGQAGLSAAAIEYVQARLQLVAEDASQRARWTMRWMECHAQAALHSRSQAATHWEACQQILVEAAQLDPQHPRLPWLRWQHARCELLRAQADVALYLAAPANAQPRAQALETVRKLLTDLDELEAELKRVQPLAARQGAKAGLYAPAEQLAKLTVDVGLLRCEAWLLRARLYDRGSADRIASATEVDQQVSQIMARTELDWLSRSQLQVAQAAAQLELGEQAAALRKLEDLAAGAAQRPARIRAATIAIEAIAALVSSAEATQPGLSGLLSRGATLLELLRRQEAGPESQLAAIQLNLAEVQHQTGAAKEASLVGLLTQSKQLGASYGDYWRSRAEALLVGAAGSLNNKPAATDNANQTGDATIALELLVVEVRQLLAADRTDQAIAQLLKFRDNQAAAGAGVMALRVASQAAALLERQQAWLQATDALLEVCYQFSSATEAASAHRQVIFYLSQALRNNTGDVALKERYEKLLLSQLELWPDAEATNEVATWLSRWLSVAGREGELAEATFQRAVNATDETVAERALLSWLGQVVTIEDDQLVEKLLANLVATRQAGKLEPIGQRAELIELAAENICRWPTATQHQTQLQRLALLQPQPDSPWKEVKHAIQWLSFVRGPQDLQSVPQELLNWEPEQLPAQVREGLARAVIDAIDQRPTLEHAPWAKSLQLDARWQGLLLESPRIRSRAAGFRLMAWGGDLSAALEGLKQLTEQAGRSGGELQLELANALVDSGANRWEDSTRIVQAVVANSPVGSELHWAARWRLYRNQVLMGQAEVARRSAQLILATQPPQSELWKSRLEQIAASQ
jgi:hypothetical protein